MFNLRFLDRNEYLLRKHTLEHKGDFLFLHEKVSAKKTFHRESAEVFFILLIILAGACMALVLYGGIVALWAAIFSAAFFFYFASLIFKAYLTIVSMANRPPSPTYEEIYKMREEDLPPYTVLVPMYKEGEVLKNFVSHFQSIDYPKDKLDVRLLLEEDDAETIKVAGSIGLKAPFSMVVIPRSGPRTKPKALNVGVIDSDSEILTVYDAEDRPEKDQLKKVAWAFKNLPKNIVCIQAKLTFYNAKQNILTKWFAAEYYSWFNHFLPALYYLSFPIPLGGTSNHFKTSILKEIGAWDPYNVTEDADLGIRISRLGYRISMINTSSWQRAVAGSTNRSPIAVIDSSTPEEANSMFSNWFRQRTRWLKGYIQTVIVHLRYPRNAFFDLSGKGFFSFIFFVLGTPLAHLLNLMFWVITAFWFLGMYSLPAGIPEALLFAGYISLVLGNLLFILLHVIPMLMRKEWAIAFAAIFIPVYWLMMSAATVRAIFQLVFSPHYWEKTTHGLALKRSFSQSLFGVMLSLTFVFAVGLGIFSAIGGNRKIDAHPALDLWEVRIINDNFKNGYSIVQNEKYLFLSKEAAIEYGEIIVEARRKVSAGVSLEKAEEELNLAYQFINKSSDQRCPPVGKKCFGL